MTKMLKVSQTCHESLSIQSRTPNLSLNQLLNFLSRSLQIHHSGNQIKGQTVTKKAKIEGLDQKVVISEKIQL